MSGYTITALILLITIKVASGEYCSDHAWNDVPPGWWLKDPRKGGNSHISASIASISFAFDCYY
jgi:hypothetical protein